MPKNDKGYLLDDRILSKPITPQELLDYLEEEEKKEEESKDD